MQEVYQQNERLMYAIALKYASNTQDCEDIVINRFDGTSTYNVDTEGAEIVEEIMINGNSGLRIVKNGQTHIALANTDKNIFIDICSSEHVPGEVVEKIAQNIFVID